MMARPRLALVVVQLVDAKLTVLDLCGQERLRHDHHGVLLSADRGLQSSRTCWFRLVSRASPSGMPFLAEAVYDDLLPAERSRIHAAYAQGGADARPALSSRLVDGTRPSWPDMLAPPTISTRRSGQASAPVTTRCR